MRNPFPRLYRLVRRLLLWQRNSRPYLSGDAFSDFCDYVACPPKFRIASKAKTPLKDARSIFCPGDKLMDFLKSSSDSINANVLIIGNSDEDFDNFNFKLPSSVKRCFVQNLNTTHGNLEVLPIGLENLRLGRNGLPKYFRSYSKFEDKSPQILVGPFAPTHAERDVIAKEKYSSVNFQILTGRYSPKEYTKIARNYQFVLCPRGNGLDTHRFWETLYRGSIPIVKRSIWSSKILDLSIPLIEVDSWTESEILSATREFRYNFESTEDIHNIWWDAWSEKLTF